MRTRAIVGGIAAAVGVLAAGWGIGAAAITPTGVTAPTAGSGVGTGTGASTSPSGTTGGGASAADGTYTGQTVSTRFGDVQVQVSVASGSITDVSALKLTDDDGRSVQISNRAAPLLRNEVLSAQSANVSTIGGATYTSDAYLTSLQSALDQAGL